MMKSKVYKITEIDNEIIDLYIECFKKDNNQNLNNGINFALINVNTFLKQNGYNN